MSDALIAGFDAVCHGCQTPYTFANAKALSSSDWEHFCCETCRGKDEISALREERDRLRAALTELVACDEIVKHLQHADGKKVRAGRWQAAWESARAALGERS